MLASNLGRSLQGLFLHGILLGSFKSAQTLELIGPFSRIGFYFLCKYLGLGRRRIIRNLLIFPLRSIVRLPFYGFLAVHIDRPGVYLTVGLVICREMMVYSYFQSNSPRSSEVGSKKAGLSSSFYSMSLAAGSLPLGLLPKRLLSIFFFSVGCFFLTKYH